MQTHTHTPHSILQHTAAPRQHPATSTRSSQPAPTAPRTKHHPASTQQARGSTRSFQGHGTWHASHASCRIEAERGLQRTHPTPQQASPSSTQQHPASIQQAPIFLLCYYEERYIYICINRDIYIYIQIDI